MSAIITAHWFRSPTGTIKPWHFTENQQHKALKDWAKKSNIFVVELVILNVEDEHGHTPIRHVQGVNLVDDAQFPTLIERLNKL